MTTVVGLTGGIGTGKSTVAGILRELGAAVLDADQVAREVVKPGSEGLAEIAEAFGPGVLTATGELDRPAMRRLIASDPSARQRLEAITHPRIGEHILGWLADRQADGTGVAVVEAALMVETGTWRRYPVVWVVTAAPSTQLARVQARDGASPAEAQAMIDSQLPMADKEAVATCVIRNDGDLDELRAAVRACWDALA